MLLRAPDRIDRQRARDPLLTWLLLGILLAGAALRLYGLDRTSLWNDETASWSINRLPFLDMLHATVADVHPPLYNLILYATIRLLGESETALRLPSAVMGIANLYLMYRLGTLLWDRLTGIFAASLLAFSGFHLWYSQEVRMYALLCLTATAFALTTARFLDKPGRRRAVPCGFAGLALLYSHVYGILNWAGIDLAVGLILLASGGWKAPVGRLWLATQGAVVLGFLPWTFVLAQQAREVENNFWIPFPTPRFVAMMVRAIAGGTPMLICLTVLALIALRVAPERPPSDGWKSGWRNPAWRKILLLSWGVLPLLGGYALSLAGQPILYDRYLIGSLPPLLLLAARGLSVLRSRPPLLAGAIAILIACDIAPVHRAIASAWREDFRAVMPRFAERFEPSDAVVFASAGIANTFAYYHPAPVARQIAIRRPGEIAIPLPGSDPANWDGAPRVWVFVRDGIDSTPLLKRIEAVYQRREIFHAYDVTLILYDRPLP